MNEFGYMTIWIIGITLFKGQTVFSLLFSLKDLQY